MSTFISSLIEMTFDVAVGSFCIGFSLLATHWLAKPVRHVLTLWGSVRHRSIKGLKDRQRLTEFPNGQSGHVAAGDPLMRMRRLTGLAGAILVGTSGALFFFGAILSLLI